MGVGVRRTRVNSPWAVPGLKAGLGTSLPANMCTWPPPTLARPLVLEYRLTVKCWPLVTGVTFTFASYRVQLAPDALWFAHIFELVAAAPLGGNLADKFLLAFYLADDGTDHLTQPHFGQILIGEGELDFNRRVGPAGRGLIIHVKLAVEADGEVGKTVGRGRRFWGNRAGLT